MTDATDDLRTGAMSEYVVSKAFTDNRIQTVYGGTTEIVKDIVGKNPGL